MATRIGVDVGGTFTDVIFYDEASGEWRIGKVLTEPAAPEGGVIRGVASVVATEELHATELFIHGTTTGLNTLLERSGPRIGMLCTEGFRDVLEIRRGDRERPYELFPKPVHYDVPVERWLRLPVPERMLSDGSIRTPLSEYAVRSACEMFLNEAVESVAIAFLNAYANPEHECRAAELLREGGFGGEIAMSHEVSREYREYERTTTTVVDAYIRPRMRSYLGQLRDELSRSGLDASLLLVRSDGGAITFDEAKERPFETILSGPVGGVRGAVEIAREMDLQEVITADVGGTSFDTAVIIDGTPILMFEGNVAGMPIQTPWVDVRSIGAGGGSIAYVDAGGFLKVGPLSAGAQPGPACYGQGGDSATTTDAAFHLGMLPDQLASGLQLDRDAAGRVLAALGRQLDFSSERVARGILAIASAAMAGAMREVTIEQGRDPRSFALMAFGGAGPLLSTLLAGELGVREIIVPPHPGNFSAWGMLGADIVRTATRTKVIDPLGPAGLDPVVGIGHELFDEIARRTDGSGEAGARELALDVRYKGQEFTLTVGIPWVGDTVEIDSQRLRELFEAEYRQTFASVLDAEIEIVTLRATRRITLPRRKTAEAWQSPSEPAWSGSRGAYSFQRDEWIDFELIDRATLQPAATLAGPALVLEPTASTYVDADYNLEVHPTGALVMRKEMT